MATAYEVEQWKDRCRRLTSLLDKSRREKEELTRRIRDNSEEAKAARAIADGLEWEVDDLKAENEKLRELVRYMYRCYVRGHDWGPFGAPEKAFVEQCMCELGIEG